MASDSTHRLTRSCSCPQLAMENRASAVSCDKGLSTDDSAYASQEESSVASTHTLTQSSSYPQLAGDKMDNQLQLKRSNSLPFEITTPFHPTQQPPVTSNLSLASSHSSCEDIGQCHEGRSFEVTLQQRVSGVGLLLGTGVSGGVVIKYVVSFGSAAKEGTLR